MAHLAQKSTERRGVAKSDDDDRIRTTVALYTPPGPVWQRLAHSATAFPDVEVTAIISPRHSDNDSPFAGDDIEKYIAHNQTWLDGMESLRKAGIRIQHYLHLRNLTCPRQTQDRPDVPTSGDAKGCTRGTRITLRDLIQSNFWDGLPNYRAEGPLRAFW